MSKKDTTPRAEYVKEVVNNSSNTTEAVKSLANELFLSERTIWRDYGRE